MSKNLPTPCTWAEAELISPGVESEWRGMLGRAGTCIPPVGMDWRLELRDWGEMRTCLPTVLHVIQIDHEGKWKYPPEWRCWTLKTGSRTWTHPFPITMLLWSGPNVFTYEPKDPL
jgi:hypothetical protein